MATAFFFYLFSVLAIASGATVVFAKNPVHAVLFLILTFFNAAGLFVLLNAEFLAMLLIVVYVGAVAVLFLFVVMMLDVDFAELKAGFIKNAPIGVLVGGVVLAELIALFAFKGLMVAPSKVAAAAVPSGLSNTEALGQLIYTKYFYFFQRGRHDFAGRYDRRDRADVASSREREAAIDFGASRTRSEDSDGSRQGS